MPKPIRKLPKVRIFQPDQLQASKAKFACHTHTDVVNYIHSLDEYKSFLHSNRKLISRYIALIFNLVLPKLKNVLTLVSICMQNLVTRVLLSHFQNISPVLRALKSHLLICLPTCQTISETQLVV